MVGFRDLTHPVDVLLCLGPAAPMVGVRDLGADIVLSPFPSATIESTQRRLRSWPRRPIYFLLDNVQKDEADVVALLEACEALEHYGHVRFVLAYVESLEGQTNAFLDRLPFTNVNLLQGRVGDVDGTFVKALAEVADVALPRSEASSLIEKTRGNLSRIVAFLRKEADNVPLDQTATLVLRLLFVAQQPLRRSDLRAMALESAELTGEQIAALESSIRHLENERVISASELDDGDLMVSLSSTNSETILRACGNELDLWVPRDLLYRYCSRALEVSSRHAASSFIAMLYRLANIIDKPAVPRLAQELVRVAMGQGSLEQAQRYIKAATPSDASPSLHDAFVQIAFYVSVQSYAEAKSLLDSIPRHAFERFRVLRILDAICLNRTRVHDESDARIDALLGDSPSKDEINLLVAYKIGGLLHEERFAEARNVFERWEPSQRRSSKYGYFLRNGAAVYMLGPNPEHAVAANHLNSALAKFRKDRDAFGAATTRCNLGVAKAYLGDYEAAKDLFADSYHSLNVLGTQHIQESGTNLGTILMVLGQRADARAHLDRMLAIMELEFPRVIAECNMAILDACQGSMNEAIARMEHLVANVERIGIKDATRRAWLTSAIVHAANGDRARSSEFLKVVLDMGHDDSTVDAVGVLQAGEIGPAVLERYPYEYMQYWSLNPLMMVPSSALTEQAVLNNVA